MFVLEITECHTFVVCVTALDKTSETILYRLFSSLELQISSS
jgi:hypothetical protein